MHQQRVDTSPGATKYWVSGTDRQGFGGRRQPPKSSIESSAREKMRVNIR